MTTTLTLTPDTSTASVTVVVSGAAATVRIYRAGPDGRRLELRGSPFATISGDAVVIDAEAPFGFLRYSTDDAAGVPVTTSLDVTRPWLTHPYGPFLSVPVDVLSDAGWSFPGRTYVYDVINRATPVYTWYRRSSRSGVLAIRYASASEREGIRAALVNGAPMLIRYPPSHDQFTTSTIGIGEARVIPSFDGARAGVIELEYVVVDPIPGPSLAAPGWTWQDVHTAHTTWRDLQNVYPSWRALQLSTAPVGRASRFGA